MSAPLVFWRDGHDSGRGGCFVRGASLNDTVARFEADGHTVAGIIIDPAHESNVELILGVKTGNLNLSVDVPEEGGAA